MSKTNTYLEEPVPFFDDAMAMLRYSIGKSVKYETTTEHGM